MSKAGRLLDVSGWLLCVVFLTLILYVPIWLAIGMWLYPNTHPDYWTWATPGHIFPISGSISLGFMVLATWAWRWAK